MTEQDSFDYVGLDIAKERFDYCLTEHDEGMVASDPAGRLALIKKVKTLPRPCVVCEASGGYEKVIVAELIAAGIEVCVVQPGRVRGYAEAEGLLAKTDRLDARLLRRFGYAVKPRLALPADPVLAILRELLEHRRALTTQRTEVNGRLALAGPTLSKLLGRQRTFLDKEIAKVEKLISQHIYSDPDLRAKWERLQEITSVGPVLASTILAYIPELGKIEAPQISALIGVAPYPRDSAKSSRRRKIRGGRYQVRHVLYMAARTAVNHNPILSAIYHRLFANGKPDKVCIVAVMRKLACLMNRLIQDPTFVLAS